MIDSISDFFQKIEHNPLEVFIDAFAKSSGVKVWDWIAVFIAIIALIIAYKTLRSQKRTQENTKSLVKPHEAITTYLRDCVIPLIRIESFIYCFNKYCKGKAHRVKFSKVLFTGLHLEVDNSDLFYEDQSTYSSVSNFKTAINSLNERMESFISEINNPEITDELYDSVLHDVNYALANTYYYWYILFINVLAYQLYKKRNNNFLLHIIDVLFKFVFKRSYTRYYAYDSQNAFEQIVLARFESFEAINSRGMESSLNLFPNYDTITNDMISDFMEFCFSESIYGPLQYKNDYWNFMMLRFISLDERKEYISYYLNLHLSSMENRFNKLMIKKNKKG